MTTFSALCLAEVRKSRHSPVARLVWLLPLLFVAIDFLVFQRPLLGLRSMPPALQAQLEANPGRLTVALWGGLFHPLAMALVPALVFRPEYRFKTWRHLRTMPVGRRQFFLAKAAWVLFLSAAMLLLVGLLLGLEHRALSVINPLLALPIHGGRILRILATLWVASLPLLAIYLWVCDRISSLAVPVVFGLAGLILTIALTGQELDQPWRRDLIPWVLPYAAAEQIIHTGVAQQEAHAAGTAFQPEPGLARLPSGRRIKIRTINPEEVVFPPPPPTPTRVLASFSVIAALALLFLGWLDAARERV